MPAVTPQAEHTVYLNKPNPYNVRILGSEDRRKYLNNGLLGVGGIS